MKTCSRRLSQRPGSGHWQEVVKLKTAETKIMIFCDDHDMYEEWDGPGTGYYNKIDERWVSESALRQNQCASSGLWGYIANGYIIVICPRAWEEASESWDLKTLREQDLDDIPLEHIVPGSLTILHELLHAATNMFDAFGDSIGRHGKPGF